MRARSKHENALFALPKFFLSKKMNSNTHTNRGDGWDIGDLFENGMRRGGGLC